MSTGRTKAPRKKPRHIREARRVPRQERSQVTVDALLDATERVLGAEGLPAVTTVRVARVAGVSIGSLYQYFPTREALLAALEQRTWAGHAQALAERVSELAGQPLATALPEIVAFMVRLIAGKAAIHAMTNDEDLPKELGEGRRKLIEQAVTFLAAVVRASYDGQIKRPNLELAITISLHAVTNLTRIGVRDHQESVKSGEIAEEIAAMVTKYLLA